MEKALVVSILEDTYLKNVKEKDDDSKKYFPPNWDEFSLDDKMVMLGDAISKKELISYEEETIELNNQRL